MKNTFFPNLLVLVALLAYHFLFWEEQMGLNTLLFAVLLIGFSIVLKIDDGFSKAAAMSMVMTFLTAVFVVWHNSDLSKIVHLLSAVTTIGFVHRRDWFYPREYFYGRLCHQQKTGCFPSKTRANRLGIVELCRLSK